MDNHSTPMPPPPLAVRIQVRLTANDADRLQDYAWGHRERVAVAVRRVLIAELDRADIEGGSDV